MKNLSSGPTLSPLHFSHTTGTMTSRFGIADDEHGESLQRTRRNSISWYVRAAADVVRQALWVETRKHRIDVLLLVKGTG